MTTLPEPPPEAQLIARLRGEMRLSVREAARRAGIGVATWTQNEQAYRRVAPGMAIRIRATDDKLAAMALVVGAAPGQLREAGRDGAAAILARLIDAAPDPVAQMVEKIRASSEFTEGQKRAMIRALHDSTG